ncbi:MAG: hypothetical protein K2L07_14500 [Lachnospiraceae bacterium]|nr:hypothetical protein [Lachnospiraceae bacterium]
MINYIKLADLLKTNGMEAKQAQIFVKKLQKDQSEYQCEEQVQEWAIKRGFFPGYVKAYGLSDVNYHNYLSHYAYFMLHPLNNHFRIWINDKLTMKYIMCGMQLQEYLPEYYLYIENDGSYTYLVDAPPSECLARDGDFLWNLLNEKRCLALKPNNESCGGGFIKLQMKNRHACLNDQEISHDAFCRKIPQLKNYIVTEYVKQSDSLQQIWSNSECVLRIVMAKNSRKKPEDMPDWHCAWCYAVFGVEGSGSVSNEVADAVCVGFDFDTGRLFDAGSQLSNDEGENKIISHPGSGFTWSGFCLPDWEKSREIIMKVCMALSSLDWLGMDVIITQAGLKFCEINSFSSVFLAQRVCGPALANARNRKFFEGKGLNKIDSGEFWEMYKVCKGSA